MARGRRSAIPEPGSCSYSGPLRRSELAGSRGRAGVQFPFDLNGCSLGTDRRLARVGTLVCRAATMTGRIRRAVRMNYFFRRAPGPLVDVLGDCTTKRGGQMVATHLDTGIRELLLHLTTALDRRRVHMRTCSDDFIRIILSHWRCGLSLES